MRPKMMMRTMTSTTRRVGDTGQQALFQFDSETGDRTADRRKSNAPKIQHARQNQGFASFQKPAGLLSGPNSAWFGSKLSTTSSIRSDFGLAFFMSASEADACQIHDKAPVQAGVAGASESICPTRGSPRPPSTSA